MNNLQKTSFICMLFFLTLVILSSFGCDDYNIVEPQFAKEDDFDNIQVFRRDDLKQDPYFINFAILEDCNVRVSIFRGNGELVKIILDEYLSAGLHEVCWDLIDNNNQEVEDGIYCAILEANNHTASMMFKLES